MNKADLVLYSKAIFDSVKDEPFDGAVAISGNYIVYVGSRENAADYIGENTVIKDFEDKMIMPGFFDAHGHYQTAAVREFGTCISHLEECRSEQETVEGVKKYLQEHPDCKRVHGRCFFITSWGKDAPEPTKKSLDAEFPDIPVYLISSNGHVSWLNQAAIEECNLEEIIRQHPEWPKEFARRDENGELTGFIAENLSYTVRYMVEVYEHDEIAKWDREFMHMLTEAGITGFTCCNVAAPKVQFDAVEPIKQMENEGTLTIRYHQWCGQNIEGNDENHAAEDALQDLKHLKTYLCSDKVRIAGAKFMLDGVPDSYTGAMIEPYEGKPSTRGELLGTPEAYKRVVTAANKMGFSVKVHCLGNRSVRTVIDAYEASMKVNGNLDLRNCIEHMPLVEEDDIKRMAKLNIIASVQPSHLADWFNGCGEKIYGMKLHQRESCYRTLIDAGVKIAVGTDTPVVRIDPLRVVYEAVTRRGFEDGELKCVNPEEAMTLSEVLKGYTIGSAYSNSFEDKVGTLEKGKYADIAVIDKNLFEIPTEEIKSCKNVCTIFDGKIVYEA